VEEEAWAKFCEHRDLLARIRREENGNQLIEIGEVEKKAFPDYWMVRGRILGTYSIAKADEEYFPSNFSMRQPSVVDGDDTEHIHVVLRELVSKGMQGDYPLGILLPPYKLKLDREETVETDGIKIHILFLKSKIGGVLLSQSEQREIFDVTFYENSRAPPPFWQGEKTCREAVIAMMVHQPLMSPEEDNDKDSPFALLQWYDLEMWMTDKRMSAIALAKKRDCVLYTAAGPKGARKDDVMSLVFKPPHAADETAVLKEIAKRGIQGSYPDGVWLAGKKWELKGEQAYELFYNDVKLINGVRDNDGAEEGFIVALSDEMVVLACYTAKHGHKRCEEACCVVAGMIPFQEARKKEYAVRREFSEDSEEDLCRGMRKVRVRTHGFLIMMSARMRILLAKLRRCPSMCPGAAAAAAELLPLEGRYNGRYRAHVQDKYYGGPTDMYFQIDGTSWRDIQPELVDKKPGLFSECKTMQKDPNDPRKFTLRKVYDELHSSRDVFRWTHTFEFEFSGDHAQDVSKIHWSAEGEYPCPRGGEGDLKKVTYLGPLGVSPCSREAFEHIQFQHRD